MIDLDAMDADPWPTWPVDKQELRMLVEKNERLRAANDYLCNRVDYLPYCHEIERLRAALREVISVSDRKTDIYDRAKAVLAGEKTDEAD
jgi:hypothetical protein